MSWVKFIFRHWGSIQRFPWFKMLIHHDACQVVTIGLSWPPKEERESYVCRPQVTLEPLAILWPVSMALLGRRANTMGIQLHHLIAVESLFLRGFTCNIGMISSLPTSQTRCFLLLKVWSRGHQYQHHLSHAWNSGFQIYWIRIYFFTKHRDSYAKIVKQWFVVLKKNHRSHKMK